MLRGVHCTKSISLAKLVFNMRGERPAGHATEPRTGGGMSMEQVKTKSVEPQQRFALSEVTWDDLNEAGAYVERGSGDLYRIPKEALIPGGSPIIHNGSAAASSLVQVTTTPVSTTLTTPFL